MDSMVDQSPVSTTSMPPRFPVAGYTMGCAAGSSFVITYSWYGMPRMIECIGAGCAEENNQCVVLE
jgi:hypothetical protein